MVPFVGPSYTLNTRKADVQRTVNMYPVMNEVAGGKTGAYLESIPGLTLFSSGNPTGGWEVTTADPAGAFAFAEGNYRATGS